MPDKKTSEAISKRAISQKLAACVNIFGPISSIFRWKGKIQTGIEFVAFFKTSSNKAKALQRFIVDSHPYQTPCCIHLNSRFVNKEYLNWVFQELE